MAGFEGLKVDRYTIGKPIGKGGFASVYQAKDENGKLFAIKFLHPGFLGSEDEQQDARARLEREAKVINHVRSSGVARIVDANIVDDNPYIVMDLVRGLTISKDVRDNGTWEITDLIDLAEWLGRILEELHAAAVLHRDIKPSNIMISRDGPVLIDFGIAKVAGQERLTRPGSVVGTPGYLSPQLITGEEPAARDDWWAWLAVLLFCATGRAPFGDNFELALARAKEGNPDVNGLSEPLARVFRAGFQTDPLKRPSPPQLVAGLKAAVEGNLPETEMYQPKPSFLSQKNFSGRGNIRSDVQAMVASDHEAFGLGSLHKSSAKPEAPIIAPRKSKLAASMGRQIPGPNRSYHPANIPRMNTSLGNSVARINNSGRVPGNNWTTSADSGEGTVAGANTVINPPVIVPNQTKVRPTNLIYPFGGQKLSSTNYSNSYSNSNTSAGQYTVSGRKNIAPYPMSFPNGGANYPSVEAKPTESALNGVNGAVTGKTTLSANPRAQNAVSNLGVGVSVNAQPVRNETPANWSLATAAPVAISLDSEVSGLESIGGETGDSVLSSEEHKSSFPALSFPTQTAQTDLIPATLLARIRESGKDSFTMSEVDELLNEAVSQVLAEAKDTGELTEGDKTEENIRLREEIALRRQEQEELRNELLQCEQEYQEELAKSAQGLRQIEGLQSDLQARMEKEKEHSKIISELSVQLSEVQAQLEIQREITGVTNNGELRSSLLVNLHGIVRHLRIALTILLVMLCILGYKTLNVLPTMPRGYNQSTYFVIYNFAIPAVITLIILILLFAVFKVKKSIRYIRILRREKQ